MSYRSDNEPEYIDDDDYIDPDGFVGSGRRASNVLGGSGSRDAYAQPPDDGSRAGNATGDTGSGRANRPPKKGGGKRGPSGSAKARNPAPSVASSEERRARLAGKKTSLKDRDSSRSALAKKNQRLRTTNRTAVDGCEVCARASPAMIAQPNPSELHQHQLNPLASPT